MTDSFKAAEGLDESGLPAESYIPEGGAAGTAPAAPGGQMVFDAGH